MRKECFAPQYIAMSTVSVTTTMGDMIASLPVDLRGNPITYRYHYDSSGPGRRVNKLVIEKHIDTKQARLCCRVVNY